MIRRTAVRPLLSAVSSARLAAELLLLWSPRVVQETKLFRTILIG